MDDTVTNAQPQGDKIETERDCHALRILPVFSVPQAKCTP